MLVKIVESDYGFVSRGQSRYSVPVLPDAGIADIVSGNRCPVECKECKEGGISSISEWCSQHKLLCIAVAGAVLFFIMNK